MYIVNGKVVTMAGRVIEKGVIHVAEGKIVRVGSIEEVPVSSDTEERVLDCTGGWVLPGLIEAHCHMGITEEKKGTEGDDCNENVNPITPHLRAIDAINTMDAAFDDAVRAGITAAMIGPGSSNVVGGQFAVLKTKGRRTDDLIVKAPAAMKVAFGENPKVNFSGQNKSPVTRMGIAGMLRQELFEAQKYWKKKEECCGANLYDAAGKVINDSTINSINKENGNKNDTNSGFVEDFHMEAWLPVLKGEIPLKAHAHRVDDIFTAIRIAKEFDLKLTLDHCSEGHLIAEELAAEGYPAIVGPDLASRSKIEVQNMAFKTAGILQRAGVEVAITTDHPVSLIQFLPLCAGLAVKSGLSIGEGIKAITINPARICGVQDRIGSIEEGKDADLAIFSGNPMEVFTKTWYTLIDGNLVYDYRDEGD
jgi:imidazolonepropionase-like amidohydrolase